MMSRRDWTLALILPLAAACGGNDPGSSPAAPAASPRIESASRGLRALPFIESFESGSLDPSCWTTQSTASGRVRLLTTNAPYEGSYHALLDTASSGTFARNELILTLDLAGASGLFLQFAAREYGDESHVLPSQFTGSANGDGVAISADGTNWYRVVDLSNLTSTYQLFTVDLDQAVRTASIAYNATFRIKWVQYDDYSVATDGIGIDQIVVADSLPDLSAPTGSLVIDAGAASTSTPAVTLTVTATDTGGSGLDGMRLSNDGTSWTAWMPVTASVAWSLTSTPTGGTATQGTKTVRLQLRDGDGNLSGTISDSISYAPPPTPGTIPFTDGFESGGLGPWWRSASTSQGRVRVLTGASVGTYHMVMDDSSDDTIYSRNEAVLTLDLRGRSGLWLIFQVRDFGDEYNALPTSYTGSVDGDGIAISADGTNWFRVWEANTNSPVYQRFGVDLDAAAAAAGIAYNGSFQIKFVQYDNYTTTSDGIGWDDIQVLVPPPDTTPPTGTISASAGAASSFDPAVALSLSASDSSLGGVTEMRFSNDGASWSPWERYATTRAAWDLTDARYGGTSASGTKTVSAQFRDAAGNVSVTATDSIGYTPPGTVCGRITAPINLPTTGNVGGSLTETDGQYVWDGYPFRYLDEWALVSGGNGPVTITVASSAFDPIVYVYQDGGCVFVGRDLNGGGGTTARLSFTAAPGTYAVLVTSTAGAATGAYSITTVDMIADTTPPTGTVAIREAPGTVSSPLVGLVLSASDIGGSGLADMSFSNDGASWSPWETFAAARSWDLTDTRYGGTAAAGAKTVRARYRDGDGNVSAVASASITYQPPVPATFPFSENFDTITRLGSAWSVRASTAYGRVVVTTAEQPRGTRHLVLDSTTDNQYARNDVDLHIDLSGRSNVVLRFWVKHLTDEANTLPTSYVDGADGDGVSISADGTRWYRVWDGPTQASTSYAQATVDLDAAIAAAGIAYNANFRIRFTQYDNFTAPTDGYAFDDVEVLEVIVDNTAPTGTVVIAGGAASTAQASVTLTLNASDTGGSGLADMRLSNDGTTWASWETYATSRTWDLTGVATGGNANPGTKRVYAQFRDGAGNVSLTASDTIVFNPPDTTAPTGSVSIEGGLATTATPIVALTVSATDLGGSGLSEMSFSNDGFGWSAWEVYSTRRNGWDLTDSRYGGVAAQGTKTAYVRFRDNAGNVSSRYSDTIDYSVPDTTPPTGTVQIAAGAANTMSPIVTLDLSATDTGGSGLADMSFSNDGVSWSGWEAYAPRRTMWDLSASAFGGTAAPGTKAVYARFRDAAGNVSAPAFDTIDFLPPDTTPPSAPGSLTAVAIDSSSVIVAWTAALDDVGVVAYVVERSDDGSVFSMQGSVTAPTTRYTDSGLLAGRVYWYRAQAVDGAGNRGPWSNESMVMTPQLPPDAGVETDSGVTPTPDSGLPGVDAGFPPAPDSGLPPGVDAGFPPLPDAGPGADGGPQPDGGPGADAGPAPDASSSSGGRPATPTRRRESSSGCACAAPSPGGSGLGLVLLLGVLFSRRRRR